MRNSAKYSALVAMGLMLVFSSCKKATIDLEDSNDPVFRADGTIDGQAFSIVAGDDNAYMFTDQLIENGVNVFSGKLDNGSFGIEMSIYDGAVDIPNHNALTMLPQSLHFSQKSLYPLATLSKDLLPNAPLVNSVQWYVNGVFVGMNDYNIMEPGKYEVCGNFSFTDGSSSEMCSELILGYKKNANCAIKHFLNQEWQFKAWIDDLGYPIEKVHWFLNDEFVHAGLDYSCVLGDSSYQLRAQIQFSNGVLRSKNMVVDGTLGGKYINDFTQFETSISTPLFRDFGIRLRMTQNGVTYSSENVVNNNAKAEILSIQYFGKNWEGLEVYKATAKVTATIKDDIGSTPKLIDFVTTFGIAIPK